MDPVYKKALLGELKSEEKDPVAPFEISNTTCMPLLLYWVTPTGRLCGYNPATKRFEEGAPGYPMASNKTVPFTIGGGCSFVLLAARSGAFAAACTKAPGVARFVYSSAGIVEPNDLGGILAEPTRERLIPGDSPRVVVGCGMVVATGATIVREQYWRLSSDSYSLGPKEKRTISYSVTDGMESTSSTEKTLAVSLGVSAEGGWGPISASVSSSLSNTSSAFQQVTLTTQSTSFESHEIENPSGEDTLLAFVWQLCDAVSVFDAKGAPVASVISALSPSILLTYDLKEIPPHVERGRLGEEQRAQAPRIEHAGGSSELAAAVAGSAGLAAAAGSLGPAAAAVAGTAGPAAAAAGTAGQVAAAAGTAGQVAAAAGTAGQVAAAAGTAGQVAAAAGTAGQVAGRGEPAS